MGGSPAALAGPDFTAGVDVSDVPRELPLLGHAHGQPVLLTRRGELFFAVSATCTHYGAPLSEGLIHGDEVRCPSHHAAFNLRNGEAMDAPAFTGLTRFEVSRQGSRLFVGNAKDQPGTAPEPIVTPSSVVIVGGGAAGFAAGEMLRRRGYRGPVKIFSADPDLPYDRPNLSKDYLAGNAPEEWIPLRPPEFYGERKLNVRTNTAVAAIDRAEKAVVLRDGTRHSYGALLLTPGASAARLPLPGAELPQVFTLRSLADARKLLATLPNEPRVVILGAGFVGLEAAAALRSRNVEVTVVAPETVPLERVVGKQVGNFLRNLHEKHGVRFRLGESPRQISTGVVVLSSGEPLAADVVLMAVGSRPETALAGSAGLEVTKRGIVVNELMQTNARDIWAAGDAACTPDPGTGALLRCEHWVVAQRQGQTAARNILGERIAFRGPPFFWSVHYDVTLSYVGHAEAFEAATLHGSLDGRDAEVRYQQGGRTVAVLTVGRDAANLKAELAMQQAVQALQRRRG